MHSSRMRTARALTVSGGGVGASQKKFWGKKLKKKRKKNWRPPPLPEKLETPPDQTPPCEQNHTHL